MITEKNSFASTFRGIFIIIFAFVLLSCNKNKTGVCTACCGSSGTTYCKNGWTKAECDEWSSQKVNGLSWQFFEGQTCEGRGTPETP